MKTFLATSAFLSKALAAALAAAVPTINISPSDTAQTLTVEESAVIIVAAATEGAAAAALSTLTVPLPTQADPFTSTVRECGGSVSAFAVVGVPTGEFFPGTTTIYLPPQAQPTSTTIVDTELNATEVIFASPLAGTCAPFSVPASASGTATAEPSATASDACPTSTCAAAVNQAAQSVLDAINSVTLISQNLQASAKQLFARAEQANKPGAAAANDKRGSHPHAAPPAFDLVERAAQDPVSDVLRGLRSVVSTLTPAIPRIAVLPPFPPGCDSDAIVIALIQFVRVHQALLNIIIGRRGLLSQLPFADSAAAAAGAVGDSSALEARQFSPIGASIAAVLRSVEAVVDQLAFAIIDLIPTRNECAKGQKTSIDGTLDEAIAAYQ